MKIIICVDRLTGGGAQRVASLWVQGFVKDGHDVSVVLSNIREPITYSIPSNVHIFNIDFNIKNGYIRHICKMMFQARKLKKIFQEVCPDVVIAVMPSWGPLIYKAKAQNKFIVIGTDHNSYERPQSAPMSKKMEWQKFAFNKNFDAVTVLTQADKNIIGNRIKNVFVLPNPLALMPVKEIPHKKNVILAAGRLDAWHYKGFDVLIKAWSLIASKHEGWILQIAGGSNGQGLSYLKELSQSCNVSDTVEFLGFHSDIISYYQNSSIFVLSSRYEGFGLVLIEAMSQGCACIACDYKGRQKEIITDKKEGLLCQPEDINGLAFCLEKMIIDEDFRHKVQEKAVERSKNFHIDKIMDRWYSIFKSIGVRI